MKWLQVQLSISCVALCSVIAFGGDLPPGGTNLLPADALSGVEASVPESAHFDLNDVTVLAQSFASAKEFRLKQQVENPWDAQFTFTISSAVKRGDVLHARLCARCVKSMTGSANVAIVFEQNTTPFAKSVDFGYSAGSEWTLIDVPFVAKSNLPAGASQLCIRLGYANQTIQIGGLQLLNYGQGFSKSLLPITRLTYGGREPDAPWRKAAADRIDKLRKADLQISVSDSAGKPVPGARVHVLMKQHAFRWGTCVAAGPMLGKRENDFKYRETLKALFNEVTIENSLKWQSLVGNGYREADIQIPMLLQSGFTVRGHNLIWPGKEFLPKKALSLIDKPEELSRLCDAHITDTASRYVGKLVDWDVINEPYANHLIQDKLGNNEMVHWFKLAKAAGPKAKLYVNDYEILASGNRLDTAHQNGYFNIIKSLLANGAPVEGIGMQAHFSNNLTDPENLIKILDRFAEFGLPIKITELDIKLDDQNLRADYMRDLTTVLFSHSAVTGVIQWGFWEKSHWIPESALFDKEWNLRPHGKVWVDLVHREWWTDVTQDTDASGKLSVRGFKGDYVITATSSDGKSASKDVVLVGPTTSAVLEFN